MKKIALILVLLFGVLVGTSIKTHASIDLPDEINTKNDTISFNTSDESVGVETYRLLKYLILNDMIISVDSDTVTIIIDGINREFSFERLYYESNPGIVLIEYYNQEVDLYSTVGINLIVGSDSQIYLFESNVEFAKNIDIEILHKPVEYKEVLFNSSDEYISQNIYDQLKEISDDSSAINTNIGDSNWAFDSISYHSKLDIRWFNAENPAIKSIRIHEDLRIQLDDEGTPFPESTDVKIIYVEPLVRNEIEFRHQSNVARKTYIVQNAYNPLTALIALTQKYGSTSDNTTYTLENARIEFGGQSHLGQLYYDGDFYITIDGQYDLMIKSDSFTEVVDTTRIPLGNIKITYYEDYLMSFNSNGGNIIESVSVPVGTDYETLVDDFDAPVRPGYKFMGWYPNADFTGYNPDYQVMDNMTWYAKWEVLPTHRLIFQTNGGTPISDIFTTNEYGISLGTIPTTTRPGYIFINWYYTPTFEQIADDWFDITGTRTVYAKWASQPRLIYNSNGGTPIADIVSNNTINVGFSELPTPTKTGYTFKGWYWNQAFNARDIVDDTVTVNLDETTTIYAKWDINKYDILINLKEGSWSDGTNETIKQLEFNQALNELPKPIRTSYRFKGWAITGTNTIINYKVNGPMSIEAVWEFVDPNNPVAENETESNFLKDNWLWMFGGLALIAIFASKKKRK